MKIQIILTLLFVGFIQLAFITPSSNTDQSEIRLVDYAVFNKGEKLEFIVHYGIINAGIATVEINKEQYNINGKSATKITGIGKSTGAFDWFFKVRDSYVTYMNTETLEPYRFVRHVDEGGFVFDQEYNFDHDEKVVVTEKNDTVSIPSGIQDLVSAYYYARSVDFNTYKVGDVIAFKAFVDGKVEPIRIRYLGKENIAIRSGNYRCYKFQPLVQKGRVFDDPTDVTVFISDDKNKVPVLIEAKVIVGSVKLELSKTANLTHPLAKLK